MNIKSYSIFTTNKSDQQVDYHQIAHVRYYPSNSSIKVDKELTRLSGIKKKVFECLIKSEGRTLERSDIILQVWNKSPTEPEDLERASNNLYKVVQKLRKILRDEELVETKPNWFQRLVLRKNKAQAAHKKKKAYAIIDNPTTTQFCFGSEFKTVYKKNWSLLLKKSLAGSALFTLLFFGFAFAMNVYTSENRAVQAYNPSNLTDIKGAIKMASASRDGSLVLFSHKAIGAKSWNIGVKNILTEQEAIVHFETDKEIFNSEPAFSPSNNKIAWIRTDGMTFCSLMVVDFYPSFLTSKQPTKTLDCSQMYFARSPQWVSESKIALSLPAGNGEPNAIFTYDINTKKKMRVTSPSRSIYGDFKLFYNHQNNLIVYLRHPEKGRGTEVRINNLDTKEDFPVIKYPHPLHSVAWYDNDHIVAKSSNGFDLVDLKGKAEPINLNNSSPLSYPFRLNNQQIGFVVGELSDKDIVVKSIGSNSESLRESTWKIDYKSVIAKQENAVAYISKKNSKHRIFLMQNGSSEPIHEIGLNDKVNDIAISPNAQLIAFQIGSELTVISKTGEIVFQDDFQAAGMAFSGDSKHIYISTQNKDGFAILKIDMKLHKNRKFIALGILPKFDNGALHYLQKTSKSTSSLFRYEPAFGESKLADLDLKARKIDSRIYDVVNGNIVFVKRTGESLTLTQRNIETGDEKELTQIDSFNFSINNSLSTVTYSRTVQANTNLLAFDIVK